MAAAEANAAAATASAAAATASAAADALINVLRQTKNPKSVVRKGCINTAITSGCKGPDLFFCTLRVGAVPKQIYEKLSRIIRPSFNISSGDIVIAYYPDRFMILNNGRVPYTHTEYTDHFILCNQFVIPNTNSTCSDRVHYYCILPSKIAAAAAAEQLLPYFFLDYDHRLINESIGTSTGDFIDSLTPQVNSQSQQSILAEASQLLSLDEAKAAAEDERLKAEAEARKKAEDERLKAEAEAKKAEEERLKAEAEIVTGAGSGGNSYLGSNSFLGSIMNSVCSLFRSARVSFDTKPDPDTPRTNIIIIGSGLNCRKMLIMFVLEAADRYDRRVDAVAAAAAVGAGAGADADALVLVTNFALDAALQLTFLFKYEKYSFKLPLFTSSLSAGPAAKKGRITSSEHNVDNIASYVCFCANLIHKKMLDIKESSIEITKLINCAYLTTMAARIVAYFCALKIMKMDDLIFYQLTSDFWSQYIKKRGLEGVYMPIDDEVDLNKLNLLKNPLKELVNGNIMPLLTDSAANDTHPSPLSPESPAIDTHPPFSTENFVGLENIVSKKNVLAAKDELNTVNEILQPVIEKPNDRKLLLNAHEEPDDPKLLLNAEHAFQLLLKARNNFEAMKKLCMPAAMRPPPTHTFHRMSRVGGSSRNKSRKNFKKNTRLNKKFRMSSKTKTKKQRRRSYSRKIGKRGSRIR